MWTASSVYLEISQVSGRNGVFLVEKGRLSLNDKILVGELFLVECSPIFFCFVSWFCVRTGSWKESFALS